MKTIDLLNGIRQGYGWATVGYVQEMADDDLSETKRILTQLERRGYINIVPGSYAKENHPDLDSIDEIEDDEDVILFDNSPAKERDYD